MNAINLGPLNLGNRFGASGTTTRRRPTRISTSDLVRRGNQLHKSGKLSEAERIFRFVLGHQPNNPVALLSLGIVAHQCKRFDVAIELITRSIDVAPGYHQAFNNLGNVYAEMDRSDEAVLNFRRAIEINSAYADAHFNLGVALRKLGQIEDAVESLDACKKLAPRRTDVHYELGQCHQKLGDRLQAQIAYRVLLDIDPDHIMGRNHIGRMVSIMGHLDDAVAEFRRALEVQPDHVATLNGLGEALKRKGHFEESLATLEQALPIDPNNVETLSNLASTHQSMGDIETAAKYYDRVVDLAPHAEFAEKSSLFVALNRPELSSEEMFALHRRLRSRHDRPDLRGKTFADRSRDSDRKLRIGLLGSDFRTHVVALNIIPLIANYDHAKLEVFLYAQEKSTDRLTQVFKEETDRYTSIGRYTDEEVAEIIERDEIDILVILAGRFDENRPLVATYRPAPIQVSFHDCATSGLEAMDYWLTDPILHPADTSEKFTEQLYRLPVYYQYPVQSGLPEISALPALNNGFITFGCFNKPEKINDEVVSLWAEVLHAVPQSKLLLKYFNHYSELLMQRRWIEKFAAHGIEETRLLLKAKTDNRTKHLALYHDVDIALDPFPFNGATTTFESLTMGVPVVSLLGKHFVDRVAASMVSHAGFPELVAPDRNAYVALAASLAGDLDHLTDLRAAMRARLHASPLCDGPRYARSIEAAFRDMWRTWCETGNYREK